jgi:hypothetical protein
MRIVDIVGTTKPISSPIRNAYIDFSKMTASLVAIVTDIRLTTVAACQRQCCNSLARRSNLRFVKQLVARSATVHHGGVSLPMPNDGPKRTGMARKRRVRGLR